MIKKSAPENVDYSRLLMLSACLLLLLSFGYRSGFGLFVKPITEANDWGREVISVALAVQNLFWGIVAVFAGGLADRFGNVKVIVAGTILYALGMRLMSGVDNPWMLNASTGLLVGAGVAGTRHSELFSRPWPELQEKSVDSGHWDSVPPPALSASSPWFLWLRF